MAAMGSPMIQAPGFLAAIPPAMSAAPKTEIKPWTHARAGVIMEGLDFIRIGPYRGIGWRIE